MRIVIQDITGKDFARLMMFLEMLEFDGKKELMDKYHQWLNEDDKKQGETK